MIWGHKNLIGVSLFLCTITSNACGQTWYAGSWDASVYPLIEHPRTIGLRIEVRDAETGMYVQDATIALKGEYIEERVGPGMNPYQFPDPSWGPQPREFKLTSKTDENGVSVFTLSWQKDYPWRTRTDKPHSIGVHDTWVRAVDDIEKIQYLELMHNKYRFKRIDFSFSHLLEFGQDKYSSSQSPEVWDSFENAWKIEVQRHDVRFCLLELGTDFTDYENKSSIRPEFFMKIRNKDFGTVYSQPMNMYDRGDYPQSKCGPFFIYLIEVSVKPVPTHIDLH